MELTWITKALLWCLSKRPDIGNLNVREPEPTDWAQDLDYEEMFADLSPEEQRLLQIDYFEDCWTKSITTNMTSSSKAGRSKPRSDVAEHNEFRPNRAGELDSLDDAGGYQYRT